MVQKTKEIIIKRISGHLKKFLPNLPEKFLEKYIQDILNGIDPIISKELGKLKDEFYEALAELDDKTYDIIAASILGETRSGAFGGIPSPETYNPKNIDERFYQRIFETIARYVLKHLKRG